MGRTYIFRRCQAPGADLRIEQEPEVARGLEMARVISVDDSIREGGERGYTLPACLSRSTINHVSFSRPGGTKLTVDYPLQKRLRLWGILNGEPLR